MKLTCLSVILLFPFLANAQTDTTGAKKNNKIYFITGTTAFYGLSVLGMNELWYKNYDHSPFHWVDDSREWMQVDKTGHFISSYIAVRTLSGGLKSAGLSENNSMIWASGIAMIGVSTIEVFDGFSAGWGASISDLIFNAGGVAAFTFQSIVWKHEKIIPKISWHPTTYARYRPELLGNTFTERILKDYNGHTLWLSFNLKSITGAEFLPPWLCISTGYGAEGMISGYDNPDILPYFKRHRQYYFSLDADLGKINSGNKTINKVLYYLNFIKLPFPALIIEPGGVRVHGFYF